MSCKCKNIIENFQGGSIPLLTTIGSQSACTSATTTVLIVSGKTNFGCDINVLNGGGIFSGGTNILDMFSAGSGSNYFTTGGTYNNSSGVLSLFLNDGNNFNVSGFTTSSGGATFTVAGDNGTPFTIVSGDTLQFVGQTGLNIGVSDPEVRIAMDYSGPDSFIMAASNGTSITVDGANDKLVIYDDDAAAVKYINANQLGGGSAFTGNTSATCINELWVSNISGCSPVTIGTELVVNGIMSGKTTTLFGNNNPGSGTKAGLTPTLTIFDNPGTGGGTQNFAGPTVRFSDNGNDGEIFYRYNGGGSVYSNSFNFTSDGGFNFDASGNHGNNASFFRVAKGQAQVTITENASAPRTDFKIHNANGGSAYSRMGVGAQQDYWYMEADDVNTPMHIGYDDNGVDTNVITFNKKVGELDGSFSISSGLTSNTLKLTNIPSYNDDSAAGTGGLSVGDVYQTSGAGAAPLNVAGILMIKQ